MDFDWNKQTNQSSIIAISKGAKFLLQTKYAGQAMAHKEHKGEIAINVCALTNWGSWLELVCRTEQNIIVNTPCEEF